MSNKLVSIIIPTFLKENLIYSCIESIKKQAYPYIETIIIDNSNSCNFVYKAKEIYPKVIIYSSPRNLFYGGALNKGIDLSKGNFILCLNDDTVLDRDFISEAIRGFDINASIGMINGKILRFDKKTIDSTGLFLSIWRSAKERGYNKKDRKQYNLPGYIFGVTGAAGFYRKEMLDKIKINSEYFDSDFCFFYEDLDIAWRAYNLGWKGYYTPKAIVYHKRGATARITDKNKFARLYINDELLFHLVKNRYLCIIKNHNLIWLLLYWPFIIFYDIAAWGYLIIFRFNILKTFFAKPLPIKSAIKKRGLFKIKKPRINIFNLS